MFPARWMSDAVPSHRCVHSPLLWLVSKSVHVWSLVPGFLHLSTWRRDAACTGIILQRLDGHTYTITWRVYTLAAHHLGRWDLLANKSLWLFLTHVNWTESSGWSSTHLHQWILWDEWRVDRLTRLLKNEFLKSLNVCLQADKEVVLLLLWMFVLQHSQVTTDLFDHSFDVAHVNTVGGCWFFTFLLLDDDSGDYFFQVLILWIWV